MQKSCRKVLQHRVRSKTRFRSNFGTILGGFREENPPKIAKKASQSACEKTADFWHAKKTQKVDPRGGITHARRHARRRRGGLEGCNILQKSAKIWKSCEEVMRRSLCQTFDISPTRRAGCGGFKLFAHSAEPILDVWMLGCLEDGGEE